MLRNKVAMVTGSSRGIGQAVARAFAKQGAKIIVHYHNHKQEAEDTLQMIKNSGSIGQLLQADLSDRLQVAPLVKEAIAVFGRLDILVNNAGIRKDGLMLTMRDADWGEVIRTNLDSVFYCSKAVGKYMVSQKSGVIVNIASLSGVCGRAGQSNYAASKAGVIGLTKSLALELARWNIRVNAIAPGMIATDMTKDLDDKVINSLTIPLGRLGRAEEVAQCAVFLASDMSSYMTGATVDVNGGVYM